MKAKLIAICMGCLLISSFAYASCGTCAQKENPCERVDTCKCADLNYDANPCMSVSKYCENFGNIGGLDPYP